MATSEMLSTERLHKMAEELDMGMVSVAEARTEMLLSPDPETQTFGSIISETVPPQQLAATLRGMAGKSEMNVKVEGKSVWITIGKVTLFVLDSTDVGWVTAVAYPTESAMQEADELAVMTLDVADTDGIKVLS